MEGLLVIILVIASFSSISTQNVGNGNANNVKCRATDREALLDFKNGLNDPENRLSSWRGIDCCIWRGIGCNNATGSVTKIDLHNPYPDLTTSARYGFWNLSGEIRHSLLNLKSLQHLDLSSNTFDGVLIPEFLGNLKNLQYLNLFDAGFSGIIPPTLGNLSNLQYLDVSSGSSSLTLDGFQWITGLTSLKHLEMKSVDLSLVESNWLEMLNMLPHLTELHLASCFLFGSISSLDSVNFTSLAIIDLSFNSFNSMFPDWLVNISSLVYFDLSNCMLRGRIPLGFGDLPNLKYLNLAVNGNLSASGQSLFKGNWKMIEVLDLALNQVHGRLPASIGNMTTLTDFDLFVNSVEGGIPSTIGRLCKLVNFDISGNKLTGSLPEILEGPEDCFSKSPFPNLVQLKLTGNNLTGRLPEWLGELKNLEELSLGANLFEGPIPESLGALQNLTDLYLAGNKLNGTLPKSIGQLSNLSFLDVSLNSLTGILTEAHFSKLIKLKILVLSSNSFVLNVSLDWIPPFQIHNLDMGSCNLGPLFPAWLKSQHELTYLGLSNSSISGSIPNWFWDLSFNLSLLNVSFNQLVGQLPNSFQVIPYADIDFSSNFFEGSIPLPLVPIELLDLSNNRFKGPIPQNISEVMPDLIFLSLSGNQLTGHIPDDIGNMVLLQVIDLSGNNLTGSIPTSVGNCTYLKVLDLGNNRIVGSIPDSLGHLNQLQSLHLNDNMILGELPSLKNLSSLETLDLGNNQLGGSLPPWISEGFSSLRILNLRSNAFSGEIPPELSNLSSLQVLDLAENNFTGRISPAFGHLKAMAQEQRINNYLFYGKYRGLYFEENLVVNFNIRPQLFTKTLSLLTSIDLSGNSLYGEIPVELTKLHGLMFLNLSRNLISGHIPESISSLRQLVSLDLSSNKLSGPIPSSITSLSFLSYLNLSNNNLSGKIPESGQMSTFDAYAFEGNTDLCGAQLGVKCTDEDSKGGNNTQNGNNDYDSNDKFIDRWFYLSIGLGFAAGILIPYLILVIKKPWRDGYFDFVDKVANKLLSVSSRKLPAKK
ncbi:LRR receptor-like serine threonine- kinase FLS2 [Olea europaea subsp. europaea]|uniref:LRR receptor-like serine threonine- kinase FLS2 n=1 Tax=Olea europaea subsp. europaea TaxID=158383 RepID=A0A8S0PIT7_OLEEU|nr:LRR receptor-like serine threonine- kinase FLS2 [Olea europaea subsp. europaea]